MMQWNFLLAFYMVYADVIREDGYHDYVGQFTIVHKGRMLRVLMAFKNVKMESCALHCVRHLRCRTFNYHHRKKDCELTADDFDEMNVDTITHGWYNYETPSKVDGVWSSWKNFTECTKTCGSGSLKQWRDCDSPKPEYGGADCKGRMRRKVKCNTQGCPVDGGWGSWRNSTDCTKTCGNGTFEQLRYCDSPKPENGGLKCSGEGKRSVKCNTQICPVNGGWGNWWYYPNECTQTCGSGMRRQWRHCDSPKPAHGGADCNGANERRVYCNTHRCPVSIAFETAKQSSVFESHGPSNAIDGSTSTYVFSDYENNPWLEVDMGKVNEIKEIDLIVKANVNEDYNLGLIAETRNNEVDAWILCKDLGDLTNDKTKFNCNEPSTKAQFLRIRSTKKCYLYIFEVEILGYESQ